MEENFKAFQEKFKTEELLLYQSKYWKWSLHPTQHTLGAGILSLNRYCEKMSDISPEESQDLQNIIQVIEHTVSKVFQNQKINYLMLMMVDPHLHYHVLPRYQQPQEFNGKQWEDKSWRDLPAPETEKYDFEMLHNIKAALQQNL
ncbi:HIT family protein [bacterium DOLZORAL124_38_8]|nr:MAG: HIT family protein [bacterium DOLZORAL124_38_8]